MRAKSAVEAQKWSDAIDQKCAPALNCPSKLRTLTALSNCSIKAGGAELDDE